VEVKFRVTLKFWSLLILVELIFFAKCTSWLSFFRILPRRRLGAHSPQTRQPQHIS